MMDWIFGDLAETALCSDETELNSDDTEFYSECTS